MSNAIKIVDLRIQEAIKEINSFTKIGEHEVVVVHVEGIEGVKNKVCRKCFHHFPEPDSTSKALMTACIQAAPQEFPYEVKARGEMVVVRLVVRDKMGNILVPQKSAEGKEWFVHSIGPDVNKEGCKQPLQVGDRVMIGGEYKKDWAFLIGSDDLAITHEKSILAVLVPKALPKSEEKQ